ncbi:DUF262 domain-containing protein [Sulfurimonas sp.]|uniref:DUF262 domain-containing protein n=1 Tax=Sulfurimonas sp. TaxID=2022749 RepID=UPI0025F94EB8|nr:DUF262 domain-containing protein [Sulfurimonas sp.]MBW6488764.1 DUF262 domain-containing HNH endonuclease family protein [Sulfurimonas sp.]
MEARQISIEDFLSSNKTRFIIPVYQRNYDWKEKNCLQLFEDIKNIGLQGERKSHFMGSIVYVANSDTDSIDLKEYVIIDGQQRLTTSTLFLKALYDVIDDEDLKDEILESFLINKRLDEKNKLKLKPIKKDDDVFKKLLKNDFDTIDTNSNIYKNYNFFKNQMIKFGDFKSLYLGFKKLFIVHIALNRRDDNPQLIFESINSTGVSLSQSDLIRNFLLMDKEADEQIELFENYWFKIEENLTSENISNFIRDYLTVKQNKIPNKDDTYEAFKVFVSSENMQTKGLLIELLEYSKIYKTFLFPHNEIYAQNLKNLKQLKIGVVYPFLLSVISSFNKQLINEQELFVTLEIIESYIIRRMVCNKATNALNKVFASLFSDILEMPNFMYEQFSKYFATILFSKRGSAIFPDDEEFRADFTSRDAYNLKNIKFILLRLENKENNEKVDIATLSIEHFMPQTLTNSWRAKLGDNYQLIHDKYLHNIGNLSLSGDNTQLGNKSFEDKKYILKEQSRLKLNQYFINAINWDDKEINRRADVLFEEAKILWEYPKELDLKLDFQDTDKEFYTLDDDIDITGKKPLYFELFNEKHTVKSWNDLYVNVVKILVDFDYDIAKSLLIDDDFSGKKQRIISSMETDCRKPYEIKESYFLETNLSANSIMTYVKLICEKFGLSGSDFVYTIRD